MTRRPMRCCSIVLGVLLTGAGKAPPAAFVDLQHLLAVHPLHGVLSGYDREISALRSTLNMAGLGALEPRVQRSSAKVAREVAVARSQIEGARARDENDRSQEQTALRAVFASARGGSGEMNSYRDALARANEANLRGYQTSLSRRTERAIAARRQELHEKELALAFDLARQNAGKRLNLRLKLHHLHLDPVTRVKLRAELTALDSRTETRLAQMRAANAAALDDYRRRTLRAANGDAAQMATALESKAEDNLALRLSISRAESSGPSVLPDLSARLAWFAATYRLGPDATDISGGLQRASDDVQARMRGLAQADRRSRIETTHRIQALEGQRAELYRSMVAQIFRDAQQLAKARHLGGVATSRPAPKGSVDLTHALADEIERF